MPQKLSILIPAYNEAATIHQILDKVLDVQLIAGLEKELLIVNLWKLHYEEGIWIDYIVLREQRNNVNSHSELETNASGNHVFYINTNMEVCALYKMGENWGDAILNSSANKVKYGTNFTVDKNTGNIYYIDDDNHINELSYSNGLWLHDIVHQEGFCQVKAISELLFDRSKLYYTGIDLKIHEFENKAQLKNRVSKDENVIIEDASNNITIYPNPVQSGHLLNVMVPEKFVGYNILIYNSFGNLLFKSALSSQFVGISTNNFKKGLYFVRVVGNRTFGTEKFIVY